MDGVVSQSGYAASGIASATATGGGSGSRQPCKEATNTGPGQGGSRTHLETAGLGGRGRGREAAESSGSGGLDGRRCRTQRDAARCKTGGRVVEEKRRGSEQTGQLHGEGTGQQGRVSWPSGQRTANRQLQRPAFGPRGVPVWSALRPGPMATNATWSGHIRSFAPYAMPVLWSRDERVR